MAEGELNDTLNTGVSAYAHSKLIDLTRFVHTHSADKLTEMSDKDRTEVLFKTAQATVLFFSEWLIQQQNSALVTGYVAVLARGLSRLKMSLDMAGAPPEVLANFDACRVVAKKLLKVSTATSAGLGVPDIFATLAADEDSKDVLQTLTEIRDWDGKEVHPDDVYNQPTELPTHRKKRKATGDTDAAESGGVSGRAKVGVTTRRKKEQQSDLVAAILAECDDGLKMVECPVKGRGIVATRAFAKGAFVVEYRGELIDRSTANQRELAYAADADVGCYVYHFVFNGRPYCVDATAESAYLGRLVNHSARRPNLMTKVVDVGGTPRLVLVAKRALAAGDELLYDYGDRSPEAVAANPWLKNS